MRTQPYMYMPSILKFSNSKCGLCMLTFSLRMQYGKERKETLSWRNLTNQVLRMVISHVDSRYSQYDVMRIALPGSSSPITYNHGLSMRKILDRSELRDIIQNIWQILLLTVKDTKNKNTLRSFQPRRPNRDMVTTCNIKPWMESWNKKEHELNANEIWMKHGCQLKIVHQYSFIHRDKCIILL